MGVTLDGPLTVLILPVAVLVRLFPTLDLPRGFDRDLQIISLVVGDGVCGPTRFGKPIQSMSAGF